MRKFTTVLAGLLLAGSVHATNYYLSSAGLSAPQTAANWGDATDGSGNHPADFTGANDVFIIQSGQYVTLASYYSWTLGNGAKIQVDGVLTGSDNAYISGTGTFTGTGNIYLTNPNLSSTMSAATTGGTFTYASTAYYGNYNVARGTYYNLTFSGGGTFSAQGNISIANLLTVGSSSSPTFAMGSYTLSGAFTEAVSSGTISTGGSLPSGKTWRGTVKYTSSTSVAAGTYNALSLDYGVTGTASGDISVNYSLDFGGGQCQLNMGTYQLTGAMSYNAARGSTSNGMLRTKNTSTTPFPAGLNYNSLAGSVYYEGYSPQYVLAGTYGTLYLNSVNTFTATGNIVCNSYLYNLGTFNLGTYQLSGNAFYTSYNIANYGTIKTANTGTTPLPSNTDWTNISSSTVEFNGTAAQSIPAGTYRNLKVSNTSATVTARGALIIGASSSSSTLTIASGAMLSMNNYNLTFAATGTNTLANSGTLNMGTGILTHPGTPTNNGTLLSSANSATGIPSDKTWGGTVSFGYGGSTQRIPAGTYNNLSLTNTANSIPAGGDLTVNGTLLSTAGGTLDLGTYALGGTLASVNNSGSIRTANTGAAALASGKTWGGSGTLYFYGAASQTVPAGTYQNLDLTGGDRILTGAVTVQDVFTRGSGNIDYSACSLTLNGAGDETLGGSLSALAVTGGATITLSGATTVNGTLALTSGKVLLNGANLTVGGLSGGSATAFIVSGGNTVTVNNLSGTVTVPVGYDNGSYTPVTLTPANTVNWTVGLGNGVSASNPQQALQRTWYLTPSATPGATNVTFDWNPSDAGMLSSANGAWNGTGDVLINHYNSSTHAWETAGSGSPQVNGSRRSITLSGQTAFSPFAISQVSNPLPVTLLRFSGRQEGGRNLLGWATATESNSRGFSVERSSDGRSFTAIGLVASRAPGGNSSSELSYAFSETAPSGNAYYRLVQQDLDGRSKTSAVLLIRGLTPGGLSLTLLYPNPATRVLRLALSSSVAGAVQLQVRDAQGRLLRSEPRTLGQGANVQELDVSNLPAGVYTLQATDTLGNRTEATFVKR